MPAYSLVKKKNAWILDEDQLWILGISFISALLAHLLWADSSVTSNFKQFKGFLLLISGVGIGLLLFGYQIRRGVLQERFPRVFRRVKQFAAWMGIGFCLFFLIQHFTFTAWVLACLELLLMKSLVSHFEHTLSPLRFESTQARMSWAMLFFLFHWGVWHMMLRLPWYEAPAYHHLFTKRWDSPFLCLLVLWSTLRNFLLDQEKKVQFQIFKELFPLLILTFGCFQTPRPMMGAFIHHWGVYVGAADLIQSGGTLYWDVPSQYGLLSLISWILIPIHEIWIRFYLFQALCLTISAFIVYFFNRHVFSSKLFSFFLSFCVVLCIPGWAQGATGVYGFPSSGTVRFLWVYILGVQLFQAVRTKKHPSKKDLFLFSLSWVLGSLWSAESFIYCTSLVLPFYPALTYEVCSLIKNNKRRLKSLVLFNLIPFGLLGMSLIMLWGISQSFFSGLPEWKGFFEYALSYSSGFSPDGKLIDPSGSVWLVILFFGLLLTGFVELLQKKTALREKAFLLSLIGGMVTLTSYYFGRGHENNILNLIPLYWIIILLFWMQLRRTGQMRLYQLTTSILIPFIAMTLSMTYRSLRDWGEIFRHALSPSEYFLPSLLIPADQELLSLFNKAHLLPEDPLVSDDANFPPPHPDWDRNRSHLWKPWLPISPAAHLESLPLDRMREYFVRFMQRVKLSGWFLQSKATLPMRKVRALLQDEIFPEYFTESKRFESENWLLIWYDCNALASKK